MPSRPPSQAEEDHDGPDQEVRGDDVGPGVSGLGTAPGQPGRTDLLIDQVRELIDRMGVRPSRGPPAISSSSRSGVPSGTS